MIAANSLDRNVPLMLLRIFLYPRLRRPSSTEYDIF